MTISMIAVLDCLLYRRTNKNVDYVLHKMVSKDLGRQKLDGVSNHVMHHSFQSHNFLTSILSIENNFNPIVQVIDQ